MDGDYLPPSYPAYERPKGASPGACRAKPGTRRFRQIKARLKAEPLPQPDDARPMGGRCDEGLSEPKASGEETEEQSFPKPSPARRPASHGFAERRNLGIPAKILRILAQNSEGILSPNRAKMARFGAPKIASLLCCLFAGPKIACDFGDKFDQKEHSPAKIPQEFWPVTPA